MSSPGYDKNGSLAEALRGAMSEIGETRRRLEVVKDDIRRLIETSYAGWRPLFPTERSWRFVSPDRIHVYGAIDAEAAAAPMHRAGFRLVTAHDHPAPREDTTDDGLNDCGCATRMSP